MTDGKEKGTNLKDTRIRKSSKRKSRILEDICVTSVSLYFIAR